MEDKVFVDAVIVESVTRPGLLSVRTEVEHGSATPLKRALKEAGFMPGDKIRIIKVGQ